MKNRFRLTLQGSATALTAMAVALLTFHGQPSVRTAAASVQDTKVTAYGVRAASGTPSGFAANLTKVDFDPHSYRHPL